MPSNEMQFREYADNALPIDLKSDSLNTENVNDFYYKTAVSYINETVIIRSADILSTIESSPSPSVHLSATGMDHSSSNEDDPQKQTESDNIGITREYIFSLYPNPFRDKITVNAHFEKEVNLSLMLFDMDGNLLTTLLFYDLYEGTLNESFDLSAYTNGEYVLRMQAGDRIESKILVLMQ